MIEIDFETRSATNIKKAGAHRYSIDPTTEPMCLAWSIDGGDPLLWHPAYPLAGLSERGRAELLDLHARIVCGEMIEAHNAMFERAIWTNVCVARLGWPALRVDRLRCSAAKAAAYGLPRALADALGAMQLGVEKDAAGHRLMLKLSKPRRALKAELDRVGLKTAAQYLARFGLLWHESNVSELERLFAYCLQDIRAEHALSTALPDLLPEELSLWQLDQRMNWRGVRVDVHGVRRAIEIAHGELERFDREVDQLTFGAVPNCRKRAELLAFVQGLGVDIANLQAATIDLALQGESLPDLARRVLILRRESARSSIKKLHAIEARVCPDGRVRDLLVFCGAAHTGRFSGAGIQPQNLPRGNIKDQGAAWLEIMLAPTEWIRATYGDVLARLAGMLRGAITASEGRRFIASDFAAIESCVLFWLADEQRALTILRSGGSLYKDLAGEIYAISDPQQNVKKGTQIYQLGKQGVLGLGFGMGPPKFTLTCAGYGIVIEEEFSATVVKLYRTMYANVPRLWWRIEAAAHEAVRRPGTVTECGGGRVHFRMTGAALRMRLPSGRCLTYMQPTLRRAKTPWGADCEKLSYMGVDSKTHRWGHQHTFGAKLCENGVQAIARDLLRDAMLRADAQGYQLALSSHDEIVADQPLGSGSLAELDMIMAAVASWANGCPVTSEGWESCRYRK